MSYQHPILRRRDGLNKYHALLLLEVVHVPHICFSGEEDTLWSCSRCIYTLTFAGSLLTGVDVVCYPLDSVDRSLTAM